MTRQQVAKRLGKSLATVRRLEGGRLRPVQDARGVHHFDAEEVEKLARGIENGDVALWHDLRPTSGAPLECEIGPCSNCSAWEHELQRLRSELQAQTTNHQRELATIRGERDRERRKFDAEARELIAQVDELLAPID